MEKSFVPNYKSVVPFLFKAIFLFLLLGIVSITLNHVLHIPNLLGFVPLFDLNGGGFPAVFSTALLWTSAALLYLIYLQESKKKGKANYWKVLCFVFIFLGFDELIAIHENFARFQTILNKYIQLPIGYVYWVIPYLLFLTAFAFYFLRFYLQLPKGSRLRFTVSGMLYVGGALGMEIVTGFLTKNLQLIQYHVSLLEAVEEVMEMSGIVLFIRALLIHIREQPAYPVLNFSIHYHSDVLNEDTNLKEAKNKTQTPKHLVGNRV